MSRPFAAKRAVDMHTLLAPKLITDSLITDYFRATPQGVLATLMRQLGYYTAVSREFLTEGFFSS